MIICVDFDGTCVTHEYPKVGKDIGAQKVLKKIVETGNYLILWTMRSGKELQDAVDWFKKNDIPLLGVNKNPTQEEWTQSPKAYGHLYIDDAALGAPLINTDIYTRPYIDWEKVESILKESILKE